MIDANERELLRLRNLMRDPRYWRDRDAAVVAIVTDGFNRLYSKEVERAELGRAANAAGVTGAAHRRDLIIGHLAPGEIVVPPRALSPAVMAALRDELGEQLPRFIVGSGFERRNPISGLPAFSPENEDDSEGFFDWVADWVDGLTGFPQKSLATTGRKAATRGSQSARTTWARACLQGAGSVRPQG